MKKVPKKFQLIISFDDENDVSEISPAAINRSKEDEEISACEVAVPTHLLLPSQKVGWLSLIWMMLSVGRVDFQFID